MKIFNSRKRKYRNQPKTSQPAPTDVSASLAATAQGNAEEYEQEMVAQTIAYSPKTIIPGDTIRILTGMDDEYLENQIICLDQLITSSERVSESLTPEEIENMTSPDILPNKQIPVIDFWIDCCDAPLFTLNKFMYQIARAKNKGMIVRTVLSGYNHGEASKLAIQGTPGFRTMFESSMQSVLCIADSDDLGPMGYKPQQADRRSKKEKAEALFWRKYQAMGRNTYRTHTNMPRKEITRLMNTEFNSLNAYECMAMGMCDWILTEQNIYIKRNQIQR